MAAKPTYEELEQRVKELEQVEETLRESEAKFRRISENIPAVVYQFKMNPDGEFSPLFINEKTIDIVGVHAEDLMEDSFNFIDMLHPEDQKSFSETVLRSAETLESYHEIFRTVKDGEVLWVECRSTPSKMADGSIIWDGLLYDITERKQMEESLRESKEKWRSLTENSPDHIILLDLDYKIQFINNVAPGLTVEEVIGFSSLDFVPQDQRQFASDCFERVIQSSKPDQYGTRYITTKGETQYFDVRVAPEMGEDGSVVGLISHSNNVTERKELEKRLQQSQKMEAIGTLAGGIAHDFNNMLSIILGNAELAMDDVPEWNPARHSLEEIKTASLRSRDVVKQLLSFNKKTDSKQKPVNVSPIIGDSLKFLTTSIPPNIEVHKNIPDESGIISADPTQIHQVMLNLYTNAAHAMSENGGTMEVSLSVIEIGKDDLTQNIELDQGHYVKLTVSDTGHGISKEHLDRIFDPYFTTKEVGTGSGIGLSVVHGILESHNGKISVDSEYGKGTAFNLFFPVVEKEPVLEEKTDTTISTGNERILLVDDETSIVNVTSKTLKRLGYIVTAKTSSTETLETFKAQPDDFDLIISDMTMPEITGDKLAKELQQIRPDIPIILCTGYSERIDDVKAKSIGVRAIVMKPIVKSVLAKTIRKVLD